MNSIKESFDVLKNNVKVFLGGTCNESTWREKLIPNLEIDYFNPVVKDWTPECQKREIQERKTADYVLYVITPLMTGVYSIAEVVDDSNKRPSSTIMCIIDNDDGLSWTASQLKSLKAVGDLVTENGGKVFYDLDSVAEELNRSTNRDGEHPVRKRTNQHTPKHDSRHQRQSENYIDYSMSDIDYALKYGLEKL